MNALAWLLDRLYPRRAVCMGCDSMAAMDDDWLCPACRAKLEQQKVGLFSDPEFTFAAAVWRYQGPAGGMVRRLKYRGVKQLAAPMADMMAEVLSPAGTAQIDMVCWVPMAAGRRREKGFDHAELLARAVAARLEKPCVGVLTRVRRTKQQAKLNGDERRKNLQGAFEASESARDKRLLLIDDVYTTGTTVRECAAALRRAGALDVSVLTFTRDLLS